MRVLVGLVEGEMERQKGKGKDWRVFGGVADWRSRKNRYRSREKDIYIKGAI